MRKLRHFISSSSQLGRALLKAGSLVAEDDLQRSLRDSVSSKAVGTVVKRISDYNKFAQFLVSDCHKRPLQPNESDFYRYLSLPHERDWSRCHFRCHIGDQGALVSGRVRRSRRVVVQCPSHRQRAADRFPTYGAAIVTW